METETKANEPVELDLQPAQTLNVVNPNVKFVYEDTVGGRIYKFDPLVVYKLPAPQAEMLVNRAHNVFSEQTIGAETEMKNYLQLCEHPNPLTRYKARWFGSKDENGNVITKTQPPPRVGLVKLDTVHGQNAHKAGLAELQAILKTQAPKPVVEEVAPESTILSLEPQARIDNTVTVFAPDMNWEPEMKIAYIKEYAPRKKIYTMWQTNINGLNKQAMDAFTNRKDALTELGLKYNVSTEYEPKKKEE